MSSGSPFKGLHSSSFVLMLAHAFRTAFDAYMVVLDATVGPVFGDFDVSGVM
ncbi:hypothetical protein SDC9_204143 [bioreactor metagenome]|uniref:Uncharacterized protein n=1 Tax=bioreactor metagenome TaxID=1076179 RepID=A0A645J7K7_9ZZZZ